jgi:hypothetical protein
MLAEIFNLQERTLFVDIISPLVASVQFTLFFKMLKFEILH